MAQDSAGDPVSPCPGPCDVVIPIVYPNQPITVEYDAIRAEMSFFERTVIDEEASVIATFTRPETSPPMSISRRTRVGVSVIGLGHAGVAFINGLTDEVAYYEYGRYGGSYGKVQPADNMAGATVSFGEDHNPTPASLNALVDKLTRTNGGPYRFEGVYIKLANGAYDAMKDFAEQRITEITAKRAAAYDIKGNHCFTFSLEVARAGGVSANVSSAEDLEIRLRTITGSAMDTPPGNGIELPSRQARYLQRTYRAFNASSGGTVASDFEYPAGLKSR
ncbi:hypothetical protein [uncultured Litoreibacter sp.]|uniref:hypothetical protein n=1 Tax=uncultured Litoreibacter sp. TaxID=1392394 RepID=UPI00262B97DA|nr:hypothetical protein [uncultured Litoreibacter sp.]